MKIQMKILIVVAIAAMATSMYINDLNAQNFFTEQLGNNPAACNNCHVMDAVYEGWYHGDHKDRAICSDCHLPQNPASKYLAKSESGIRDVTTFISGNIPDVIRATESSKEIIQQNCIRCHKETVENIADGRMDTDRNCFDCHRTVAHGERGISLSPYKEGR